MAASRYTQRSYAAPDFVESAGAILFHLSTQRVCLLRIKGREIYVLPKGRRNQNESRAAAAVREVTEETGLACRLLPVMMMTRATPPDDEDVNSVDEPRPYEGSDESFILTFRVLEPGNVKLIWWFVGAVDEEIGNDGDGILREPEERYERIMVDYAEAMALLTYADDREILAKAQELFRSSPAYRRA